MSLIAVSAPVFAIATSNKDLERPFFKLLASADSVIFVRMSPSQKTQVIEIAKKEFKRRILAIGDGYNDT